MRTRWSPNDFIVDGSICKIGCYDLYANFVGYAIIDAEEVDKCRPYKWYYNTRYVVNRLTGMHLHNLILGVTTNMRIVTDHRDGNTWDCRKENLRVATKAQNAYNIGPPKTNTSGYKGVTWDKYRNKWIAQIKKDGKNIYIGSFLTKKEAALCYNKKAKELHGEFAFQNEVTNG